MYGDVFRGCPFGLRPLALFEVSAKVLPAGAIEIETQFVPIHL